ncbi:MAG TPA: SH3-like domain-containing protein [candidate division Zixibacteria bacterium]|nr:SH3-like domain-containing protein [candidate division Zixibacteria bacterium]
MRSLDTRFKVGDAVTVALENPAGNPRTPRYIRGKRGVIGAVHGVLENPRDHRELHPPLYTVRFDLGEVSSCRDRDAVFVDVHEEWLTAAAESGPSAASPGERRALPSKSLIP